MKKKILALCLVAALAATAIAGGTLAWFTDTTDAAANTFTVGSVKIALEEPNWEGDATLMPGVCFAKDPTITVEEKSQDAYVFLKIELNKYVSLVNLMGVDAYKNQVGGLQGEYPGFTQFVEMLAADNTLRQAVLDRWFTGIDHSAWKVMNLAEIRAAAAGVADQTNPARLTVVLGCISGEDDTLSGGESVTFMTGFGMPATITASMFDGEDAYRIDGVSKSNFNTDAAPFKMTFTAYAIQKAGLDTIDAAYTALFG